jgi:hypothetical protein
MQIILRLQAQLFHLLPSGRKKEIDFKRYSLWYQIRDICLFRHGTSCFVNREKLIEIRAI